MAYYCRNSSKEFFRYNVIDEAGGSLPEGFQFRYQGGVFKISFDRIDNDRGHFIQDQAVATNIIFVSFGVNNSTNIVVEHGPNTCNVLRRMYEIRNSYTSDDIRAVMKYFTRKWYMHNGKKSIVSTLVV